MRQPPNAGLWLGLSIATMVLCCIPLGIPAVVYAAKAQGSVTQGDFALAEEQIGKAKTWTIVAAVLGLLFGILYITFGLNQSSNI